jgi:hypothetical protein
MLKFLASSLGRKPQHPLTDMHTISRWLEDLPMGDSVEALDEIARQIAEYSDQNQATTKERLAVLTTLDEGAQILLAQLRGQYLQNPRMSRGVESRLWNTVSGYYQEILRAYHTHIMEYIGNPGGSKIASAMPFLTARTLNYFSLDAKWSYYRYTLANPKLWKRIHNLYHFAEYEEFDTHALKLYAEDEAETSITRLYLQAVMLETLNTGSLTPRQIHLIEGWLPSLVSGMDLEREFKPARHVFYVSLNENHGARRVRRVEPNEAQRYWDTYNLKEKLDHLRGQLSAGAIPAKLGLTEDCKLPACLELLDRIAYFWAPTGIKRVQRVFERKHAMKSIEVVRGLNDICVNVYADNVSARCAQSEVSDGLSYEEMVDVHLYGFVTQRTQTKVAQGKGEKIAHVIVHERWVMENESEAGYGAHINDQTDDWIRLGKLVGLKPEKKGHWNIGVIRRLRRTQPNQQYVGIEVISERPLALFLRAEKTEVRPLTIDGIDPVGAVFPIPALFLKGTGQPAQSDVLILQSAEFGSGRELWFTIKGMIYHIRLKHALERGDDWLRASFEVLAKHAASN